MIDGPAGYQVICRAVVSYFGVMPEDESCNGRTTNRKRTVAFTIRPTDESSMIYVLELRGESSELALNARNLIERHRMYVSFGRDWESKPSVTLVEYEAMIHIQDRLFPIEDEPFEYVSRDYDGLLGGFQETLKGALSLSLQASLDNRDGSRWR